MNRTLVKFAIATWAASAVLIILFALFWRLAYTPPHAIWAIVTTGAVGTLGALTVAIGLWQFVRGPRRLLAAAVAFLGTTPIIWFAMYVLTLYLHTTNRQPTTYNAAVRTIAFWADSIADVEARWCYPRWTDGQHVTLLADDRAPAPAKMVAEMDKHIERMAALLHRPVPAGKARWVRGPLLGMHGNASIIWAICDADHDSVELTALDRHEMAHVFMTTSGGADQDPSMLLCEGWAETQCKDRGDLILDLDEKARTGPIYTLQELIGPEWYGRSDGPVYHHGAPLCIYLMEHYGVEKFWALYHGVRHTTFAADCERILGDSWKVVEDDFWKWLPSEAVKIKVERGIKSLVEEPAKELTFAKSVDPRDWQTIVDGYRDAWSKRPPIPNAFAFEKKREWTTPPKEPGGSPGEHGMLSKYVVDGDSVWQVRDHGPDRYIQGEVFSPKLAAFATVMPDGRVNGSRETNKNAIADAIEDAQRWSNACDLAHHLQVGTKQVVFSTNSQIEAIRRPTAADGTEWEIEYSSRWRTTGRETKTKLWVDAAADWSVVREEESSSDSQTETRYTLGDVWGRRAPIKMTERTTAKDGGSSFQLDFRELNTAEAKAVREQAESIARRHPRTMWYVSLIRPLALAVAWPGVGVLLLVAGVLMGRRGAQSDQQNPSHSSQ